MFLTLSKNFAECEPLLSHTVESKTISEGMLKIIPVSWRERECLQDHLACRALLQKAALSTVLEKWDGTKKGKKEVSYSRQCNLHIFSVDDLITIRTMGSDR